MASVEDQIRSKLDDIFSIQVLTGLMSVLADVQNPIRLNQFAAAMRELFTYTLHRLAPDENIKKCPWFKQAKDTQGPTRRQRAKYATQGGLSDKHVWKMGVDVTHLHNVAIKAIENMNKYTHVRPGSIVADPVEIATFAGGALAAFLGLLQSFEECRRSILDALSAEIDNEAINALISETILEIDELATHHSVDDVYVDKTRVTDLTDDTIYISAEGTVGGELQWGSNSDLRRGDGAIADYSFPFQVTMEATIDDMDDFQNVEYSVNASEWREGWHDEC